MSIIGPLFILALAIAIIVRRRTELGFEHKLTIFAVAVFGAGYMVLVAIHAAPYGWWVPLGFGILAFLAATRWPTQST
jgi:hypothetical protein